MYIEISLMWTMRGPSESENSAIISKALESASAIHTHVPRCRTEKREEIEYKCAGKPLHADLTLPSSVRQAEGFNKMLPPWSTPFLLTQVPKQFLSLVNQYSQVALVMLVLGGRLEMSGQVNDLCGQNSDLDFGGTSIWSHSGRLLGVDSGRVKSDSCGLWWEGLVGVMSSECINAFLYKQTSAVFGVSVVDIDDTADRFLSVSMFLKMSFRSLLFKLRVCCFPVLVL